MKFNTSAASSTSGATQSARASNIQMGGPGVVQQLSQMYPNGLYNGAQTIARSSNLHHSHHHHHQGQQMFNHSQAGAQHQQKVAASCYQQQTEPTHYPLNSNLDHNQRHMSLTLRHPKERAALLRPFSGAVQQHRLSRQLIYQDSAYHLLEQQARLNKPLCRCRVMYLGSSVPHITKNGLHGIQEPLRHLYPEEQFYNNSHRISSPMHQQPQQQPQVVGEIGASSPQQSQSVTIDISHLSASLGIDSWLSVWSNGLLLENVDEFGRDVKRFFSIESLHYCAAVRFFDTNTLSTAQDASPQQQQQPQPPPLDQNNNAQESAPSSQQKQQAGAPAAAPADGIKERGASSVGGASSNARFLPLDAPIFQCPGMLDASHPPIFAAIMRRTSGIKVLECHAFICRRDAASNALVRCCTHAYADFLNAKRLSSDLSGANNYGQQQSLLAGNGTRYSSYFVMPHQQAPGPPQPVAGAESKRNKQRATSAAAATRTDGPQQQQQQGEYQMVDETLCGRRRKSRQRKTTTSGHDSDSNGAGGFCSSGADDNPNHYAIIPKQSSDSNSHHHNHHHKRQAGTKQVVTAGSSKGLRQSRSRSRRCAGDDVRPTTSKGGSSKSLFYDFTPAELLTTKEQQVVASTSAATCSDKPQRKYQRHSRQRELKLEKLSHSLDHLQVVAGPSSLFAGSCCRERLTTGGDTADASGAAVEYSTATSSKRHSKSMQDLENGSYEFSASAARSRSRQRPQTGRRGGVFGSDVDTEEELRARRRRRARSFQELGTMGRYNGDGEKGAGDSLSSSGQLGGSAQRDGSQQRTASNGNSGGNRPQSSHRKRSGSNHHRNSNSNDNHRRRRHDSLSLSPTPSSSVSDESGACQAENNSRIYAECSTTTPATNGRPRVLRADDNSGGQAAAQQSSNKKRGEHHRLPPRGEPEVGLYEQRPPPSTAPFHPQAHLVKQRAKSRSNLYGATTPRISSPIAGPPIPLAPPGQAAGTTTAAYYHQPLYYPHPSLYLAPAYAAAANGHPINYGVGPMTANYYGPTPAGGPIYDTATGSYLAPPSFGHHPMGHPHSHLQPLPVVNQRMYACPDGATMGPGNGGSKRASQRRHSKSHTATKSTLARFRCLSPPVNFLSGATLARKKAASASAVAKPAPVPPEAPSSPTGVDQQVAEQLPQSDINQLSTPSDAPQVNSGGGHTGQEEPATVATINGCERPLSGSSQDCDQIVVVSGQPGFVASANGGRAQSQTAVKKMSWIKRMSLTLTNGSGQSGDDSDTGGSLAKPSHLSVDPSGQSMSQANGTNRSASVANSTGSLDDGSQSDSGRQQVVVPQQTKQQQQTKRKKSSFFSGSLTLGRSSNNKTKPPISSPQPV